MRPTMNYKVAHGNSLNMQRYTWFHQGAVTSPTFNLSLPNAHSVTYSNDLSSSILQQLHPFRRSKIQYSASVSVIQSPSLKAVPYEAE